MDGIDTVVNTVMAKLESVLPYSTTLQLLRNGGFKMLLLKWHFAQMKGFTYFARRLQYAFQHPNSELALLWREEGAEAPILTSNDRAYAAAGAIGAAHVDKLKPRYAPFDLLFDFTTACNRYPFYPTHTPYTLKVLDLDLVELSEYGSKGTGMRSFQDGVDMSPVGGRQIVWKVIGGFKTPLSANYVHDPEFFNPKISGVRGDDIEDPLEKLLRIFTNEAVKKDIIEHIERQRKSATYLLCKAASMEEWSKNVDADLLKLLNAFNI